MGLQIEQINYEHYLKYSIPLQHDVGSIVFHLRKLADELEKKQGLIDSQIEDILLKTSCSFSPSLDIITRKRIPFSQVDYLNHDSIQTLIEERKSKPKELE